MVAVRFLWIVTMLMQYQEMESRFLGTNLSCQIVGFIMASMLEIWGYAKACKLIVTRVGLVEK